MHAASATLEWDPNTESDLSGYRVYYGTSSGAYASVVDVGLSTRATIPSLADGQTYYFAVTAYNTSGMESAPSSEVFYSVPSVPNPVNQAPAIALSSPSEGSSYIAPATITFTSNASDADGSISKVEYFNGATKLGESNISPFSFTWSPVSGGNYTVTAVATDNLGATASSAEVNIAVVVLNPNQAPTIVIASPLEGSSYVAPASITFTSNASDADGSVVRVEYFDGPTKIGESFNAPFSFMWAGVPGGNHAVVAVATDDRGTFGVSEPVNFSVVVFNPNQVPSVTLNSTGYEFVAPASFTLTASASDTDGTIARVEFYSGTTKLGEVAQAPYTWTMSDVPAGNYTFHAVAVDNAGATASSNLVPAWVVAVNALPTVTMTSPLNGSYFNAPATITVSASASDSDGTISRVEFFDGSTLIGTSTASPYTFTWSNAPSGVHNLRAVAYDNLGSSSSSAIVKTTVNAAPTVVVSVSSTSFVAGGSITLTAAASDPDGNVKRVEFYSGNILLGKDQNNPYRFIWNNVRAGTHSFTAVAYDNRNAATRSTAVLVTVTGSAQAPVVGAELPAVQSRGRDYEGYFEIFVQGEAGQIYNVWYSDDLKSWSLLTSVLNAEGGVSVTDPMESPTGSRFYRVSLR